VAYACLAIEKDPSLAAEYTSRANLVGVVTNGTAVLGLGDIGPLAGKPVMEGKGCLFKKFAGIDVFDIELAERDPDKLVDIVAALEPTLGGVNLEDIKAPECFYIEKKLRERMNIPVFHDDQHGTAIISAPRCSTGWNWWARHRRGQAGGVGRRCGRHRLPGRDGGPGREAREHLRRRLQGRGPRRPRRPLDESKQRYCQRTGTHAGRRGEGRRRLPGLLAAGVLSAEMVKTMAASPSSWRWPTPSPRSGPNWPRPRGPTASSPPGAATTRTRSTTSCASRTSSAARWTAAPPRSPRR
jgi:malate dehydrogenase (oxaloacetate-decarboxylating)(NADP+)